MDRKDKKTILRVEVASEERNKEGLGQEKVLKKGVSNLSVIFYFLKNNHWSKHKKVNIYQFWVMDTWIYTILFSVLFSLF